MAWRWRWRRCPSYYDGDVLVITPPPIRCARRAGHSGLHRSKFGMNW